jgi:hypothetical protein
MLAFIAIIVVLTLVLPAWLSLPLLLGLGALAIGLPGSWGAALLALVLMRFAWWRRCAICVVALVCAIAYVHWFTGLIGALL